MVLVFVFLYAPIVLLIVFSFNAGNSNMVWKGFSLMGATAHTTSCRYHHSLCFS